MARETFLRKGYFSKEMVVGSTPELSAKCFSHWTSTDLEIWVENSVFAIQHIRNRKSFFEVPPPPVTKLMLLHTVVVLH